MNQLLSAQLELSLAAVDLTPEPATFEAAREQLLDLHAAYRHQLASLVEFAHTAEGAHRAAGSGVPLWGTAAACSQLYRRLCRTPAGTVAGPVVVSIARHFRRRA